MKENEFYPKALKDRLSLPTEQTVSQLFSRRRKYASVRPRGLSAPAVVLTAVLVIGIAFYAAFSRSKPAPKADDIPLVTPSVTNVPEDHESRKFISDMLAAPQNCTLSLNYTVDAANTTGTFDRIVKTYTCDTHTDTSKITALLEYLRNAPLQSLQNGAPLTNAIGVFSDKADQGCLSVLDVIGNQILIQTDGNNIYVEISPKTKAFSYYRISGTEGFPLIEDGNFTLGDTAEKHIGYSFFEKRLDLEKNGQSNTYRITDADGTELSFDWQIDMTDTLPKAKITNIKAADSVSLPMVDVQYYLTAEGNKTETVTQCITQGIFSFSDTENTVRPDDVRSVTCSVTVKKGAPASDISVTLYINN